ncbi:unnamed protein product [Acanthosepion pharaonis]|uniref:Uncharacterized protein n=1 Tax=Acanthosepion pharaonis TaxID=158019 RepID=A0A812DCX5_ACAPH|nr:unnamed protein product [Sepia pharaonis]
MSNLLGSYSDSDSQELLNLPSLKSKKPKILGKRKRAPQKESDCLSYLKWLFCTLTVAGLIALVIVSYNLMYQIDEVRKNQKLESHNQCTPEEFQRLHTQIQELNKTLNNFKDGKDGLQTVLNKVNLLNTEVSELKEKTASLEDRVAKAPLLQTLPKKVETTSKSLATLGSDMDILKRTVNSLKNEHQQATDNYENLTKKLKALVDNSNLTPSMSPMTEHFDKIEAVNTEIDKLNSTSIENMDVLRKQLGNLGDKMENEVLRINNISATVLHMSAQVYALNSSELELQNQIHKLQVNLIASPTTKNSNTTTTATNTTPTSPLTAAESTKSPSTSTIKETPGTAPKAAN